MSEISAKLKEAGLKITLPRVKILEILESNQGQHASAEDIYKMLMERGEEIGVATIYRVLTQCEQAGLVTRLQFEGDRSVFEIRVDDHHDHIVCVRCGHVEEFNDEVIEKRQQEVASEAGFTIEDHSMVLYGLCENCQNTPEV
ncbi:MAG: ferric iron uptake transcriptional regulator [Chromatiales bacterium]|nr:ferric iron uptake transcriptional regulator [Chromatiales bacterium]